jgi:5'-nucleotidase
MHFLLTNDDGIHAPGLAALERAIGAIPNAALTVVAPATEQSQCGHRVTTREALVTTQLAERRYSVGGTPADCVRIALFALGVRPDFVISGVNAGGNMGQDLVISGTVAGAREAAFHGLPAAALSHYLKRDLTVDWARVTMWTGAVVGELLAQPLADGEFWNVNYPHLAPDVLGLPPRVVCPPCRAPLNVEYIGENVASSGENGPGTARSYYYSATYAARPVEPGSDVAICFGGEVAVSRLRV